MEAKLEQKCSVFIIGSAHPDYPLYSVLERLFKTIHKNKIPCAFLEEAGIAHTLAEAIENAEKGLIDLGRLLERCPTLNTFLDSDPLTVDDFKSIYETLRVSFPDRSFESLVFMTGEALRGKATAGRIKLYKTLESLEIPFSGIDLPKTEFEKFYLEAKNDKLDSLTSKESLRISTMVENISKTIFSSSFSSGGILIVSTGMQHSRRLGANLLLKKRKNLFLMERVSSIQVFDCCSDYCPAFINIAQKQLESVMLQVDSLMIKNIYKSMSWTQAKIEDKDNQPCIAELEQCITNLLLQQLEEAVEIIDEESPLQPKLSPGQIRFFDVARTAEELLELTTENTSTFQL